MAGIVTQDNAYKYHTDSFDSQGYRSYRSQELPIGPSGSDASAMREETSNSDLIHGQFATARLSPPRIAPELYTERENQLQSGLPRGKQLSRRPSLPVTSIDHLLSPTREDEARGNLSRQVLCTNCDEFIVTHDADGNATDHWAKHTLNCPSNGAMRDPSPSAIGDNSTSIAVTPGPTAETSDPKDTNTAFRRRKVKHYELERFALLEKDPQINEIEEYRVLCAFCENWIELRRDRRYCPITWTAHKTRCVSRLRKLGPKPRPVTKKVKREHMAASVDPPEGENDGLHPSFEQRLYSSSGSVQIRRTEEERVKFLESDPRATMVEAHRILCAICGRWIQLRKNSTYCTAPWVQHARKCAAKHSTQRRGDAPPSGAFCADQDAEDEPESEEDTPQAEVPNNVVPPKRGRGRPRKRKPVQKSAPFTLRPIAGALPASSSNTSRAERRPSISPPLLRTPSPPPNHPYSSDMYWYPALPPISSYYPLYTGSQYSENDDSYSLYFHAQPPPHHAAPTAGQSRVRAKPNKPRNPNKASGSGGEWEGTPPKSLPSESTHVAGSHPVPEGTFPPQPGRAWVVWRLKNYANNTCPMDTTAASDTHSSSVQRADSEMSGSGSGSEPLPMYRSGTWPHLLDPQDPGPTQNLSPYVHPEAASSSTDTPIGPATHSAQFGHPSAQPRAEDPGLSPPPLRTPVAAPVAAPDSNKMDARYHASPHPVHAPMAPQPPKGAELDSPECRLAYTFQSIAYLFRTSFQGADDMSLDTLTAFMNRCIPHEKMYDGQEVSEHVAILGERKQLVFTKEGGVQLLGSS
ncbi:hypothetical protein JB92DRAFT_3117228 [Gautieria morchelliformis]|nr:hypothetical protein JB92DRAFT_3117228 [Gautieria morchelliformis]